jgi:hypothetical protein
MSLHCPIPAKKATIIVSFSNSSSERIVSEKPPVRVQLISESGFAGGQCPVCYKCTLKGISSGSYNANIWGPIGGYRYRVLDGGGEIWEVLGYGSCSNPKLTNQQWDTVVGLPPGYGLGNIQSMTVSRTDEAEDNCGDPPGKCTIKIFDKNNLLIYSKEQATSCPTYQVTCDNDCPPGFIKCDSPNYPGFCCIPCDQIKGELRAIRGQLIQLNQK